MISFNQSDEPDLRGYEYKIFKENQIQQVGLEYLPIDEDIYELTGFSPSNVIAVDLEETSTRETGIVTEDFENEELIVPLSTNDVYYYVKVRSVDTSNNYSQWTLIAKSNQIPLIESAHIKELSASKITSGYIGSEEIVLNGLGSIIRSSTYKPEVRNLTAVLSEDSTTVDLTTGSTTGLFEGMYIYEIRDNPLDPEGNWPGTFGTNVRISSIISSTQFTVNTSHSEGGSIKFGAYTKGWAIDGSGTVNFGGSRGISYDGVNVIIGSDVIIDAVAPESGGLFISNGANQSLAINSTGGSIGLKINDTTVGTGNTGNNYWYVNGAFKVGRTDKHIYFDPGTGILAIHGTLFVDGTVGGTSVGTTKMYLGTGAYANANTPFYVGRETTDATTVNKFSLGNKLTWDGSTLAIDGTVTIGSQTATAVSNAVTTANNAATAAATAQVTADGKINGSQVNANVTSISGGVITTGAIQSSNFSWNGLTTYSNAGTAFYLSSGDIVSKSFRIDGAGNATFSGNLSGAGGSLTSGMNIGGSLTIGDNVRINGATGDGGATTFKVRGNNNSSTGWAARFQRETGTYILEVRNDLRVGIGSGGTYSLSDERTKINIKDSDLGLNFINSLKPRVYNLVDNYSDILENGPSIEAVISNQKMYGFIAQEVKMIADQHCENYGGWDESQETTLQSISYEQLISPIVQAIQELSKKVDYIESRMI
jgi:cytoskeletal protein CcmA (bactofilin family)